MTPVVAGLINQTPTSSHRRCAKFIDLRNKNEKVNIESVRQELRKKGYVDDQGNFKIERGFEFLGYSHPDKSVEMYLQSFGRTISDWFEKFQSVNVFPIVGLNLEG